MKEAIRNFGRETGAEVVGFAAIEDYRSPRTPDPRTLLPGVRSLVVLGYRELEGGLESANERIRMMSRLAMMSHGTRNNYLIAKFIEDRFRAKAAPIAPSFPLNMAAPFMGVVADLSLRHAAVAAGLGVFGRHNLVIHPRYGTRLIFTACLTDLSIESDPPVRDELCNHCNICVETCPAKALDEEGKTDSIKCLRVSQPNGIGGAMAYAKKFIGATPEDQKARLVNPRFLELYQASFIGFEYHCFKCEIVCPACR
ncbi:MAG: 4Fe-4S binding protein [Deltaproteobacteria bacterium]|nr:4Fe-4S binding protein [Deltaproteobacteria bacterium]